jgi:transcription elongation GreA/GreB family factor
MSRVINVHATEAETHAACHKQGAIISAIETLASGGTRVVLMNTDATETMRVAFGGKVIAGPVTRTPLRKWAR